MSDQTASGDASAPPGTEGAASPLPETPARLLAKWQVYEANVQQYRTLAATVQSFFLAVGSIVASTSRGDVTTLAVMVGVTALGLLHLVWIWFAPLRARCRIVDYYKFQIEQEFTPERSRKLAAVCTAERYVSDGALRERVNAEFFGRPGLTTFRPTRFKLDIVLPGLYGLMWVLLLVLTLAHTDAVGGAGTSGTAPDPSAEPEDRTGAAPDADGEAPVRNSPSLFRD